MKRFASYTDCSIRRVSRAAPLLLPAFDRKAREYTGRGWRGGRLELRPLLIEFFYHTHQTSRMDVEDAVRGPAAVGCL